MILSRPETGNAFEQLIAELNREAQELNALGSKVAMGGGDPRSAARVLKLSTERALLRDHVRGIYEKWQQLEPVGLPILPVIKGPLVPVVEVTSKRSLDGPLLTIGEAARKVGVAPAKIREWLYAGKLAGQQGPTGKWKVSGADLIRCYRENH